MDDFLEGLPPLSEELKRLLEQMEYIEWPTWEEAFEGLVGSGGGPRQTPTEGPHAIGWKPPTFPVGEGRLPGIYSGLPMPGVLRVPTTSGGAASGTPTGSTTGADAVPPPVTYPDGIPSDPIDDTRGIDMWGMVTELLGDAGRAFIASKFPGTGGPIGERLPGSGGAGFVAPVVPAVVAGVAGAAGLAGVGLPWVDVITGNPKKGWCYDPHANNGAGAWVKRRRRRRRQLITPAEAGQLQTLMSIAGKSSDITKTWIATRGR